MVGVDVFGAVLLDRLFLFRKKPHLQRVDNGVRNLILNGKNVVQITVEALGPDMTVIGTIDQLRGNAHATGSFANAAFQHMAHIELAGNLSHIHGLPLKVNAVLRDTTCNAETLLKSVMISSLIPSLKYSCSASPLMLANGNTQMEKRTARLV